MAFLASKLGIAVCLMFFAGLAAMPAHGQTPTFAWKKSVYGHGNTDAVPGGGDFALGKKAMAVDSGGNVYVTGSSSNGSNVDFLTVKYNAAGVIQWRAIANGAGNGADVAYALALDSGGNVVVTGTSYSGSQANYLTVKYDNNGAELWRATFNGAQNGDDEAYAIAIDASGNIYVTGTSFNGSAYDFGTVLDYLTVKYSPAGVELWQRRVTGTDRGVDRPYAIAVDGSGNIVVTGYSFSGSATSNDYLTVKYDPAGTELWRRTFDGGIGGSDLAFALTTDAAGNVYITGQGFNGTNSDYLTIKYDTNGNKLWHRLANGAGNAGDAAYAITVDINGNVIVTGQSDLVSGGLPGPGNPKYMTVKYDSAGTELWRASVNGSATGYDISSALVTDPAGNIYVTGYGSNGDLITVKYAPGGTPIWTAAIPGVGSTNGAALVSAGLDAVGNVLIAGYQGAGSNNDFLVVKYNDSGVEQWRANEGEHVGISAAFASDAAGRNAMKIDSAGNVYITGRSNYGAGSDFLTAKYDASGNELWRAMANGAGNNIDQPYALAIDANGNVFVTGDSYNGGHSGMLTVKYNASGVEQWRMVATDGVGASVSARALVVDSAGDVIVTGLSYTGSDFLTVKYNAAGVEQWRAKANRAADGSDVPVAMLVDAAKNVYVTGRSIDGINDGYLTIKYAATSPNANGQEMWRVLENAAADFVPKRNFAMALDANGNLVVAGDAIVKYDTTSALLWRVEPSFQAQQVAIDSSGNIIVAGTKGVTAKYNPAGSELWNRAINGTANTNDTIRAMTLDADGNVYVSGQNYSSGNSDYVTVKYDPSGTELWRITTATQGGAYFSAAALAVDAVRSVILANNSTATGSPSTMTLTKYRLVVPAPTITSAVPGNAKATISFLPPASDGGSPITSYTVTCNPGAVSASGPSSPIVVTALANDVTHSCSVVANNALGASLVSASLNVTPSAAALATLVGVLSRKTHGAAGIFDLAIDTAPTIGGAITVEPRAIGAAHTLVFQFSDVITNAGTANSTDAQSMTAGAASAVASGNDIIVTLTGVGDNKRVVVSLAGVNNATSAEIAIGFLVGDVNNSRSVNASDISGVKARAGMTTNVSNFKFDLNASGGINATDISAVKARAGLVIP
jgi:uncharacterized delta-60 repeat protein